jgi:hypothetical protein
MFVPCYRRINNRLFTWDFPFNFINSTPAHYSLYNSTIYRSISTPLSINSAKRFTMAQEIIDMLRSAQ